MNQTSRRVALVTGANRGIGYAISRQLAAQGITVLLGVRNENRGLEARDQLRKEGADVDFIMLDVTDRNMIQAAVMKIRDRFDRLDILVNNAGIMVDSQTKILELSLGLFENTLETNTFGPLLLCQAVVPLMEKHGYGRIVNISSTLGSLSDIMNPDSSYSDIHTPAYRLSKILLNGITVLLAKDLEGKNILVNSVCPGWVRTRLGGEQAPLTPEEAVEAPVWLATLPDDGPTGGFFREHQPIPW